MGPTTAVNQLQSRYCISPRIGPQLAEPGRVDFFGY
jgi:hypothetical protein